MNASLLSMLPLWIAAALAMAESLLGAEIRHRSPTTPEAVTVEQSPRDVPVTCQADVVVAGGGVSGVAAALRAAADGCSVVLVEERNCLGSCDTVPGRPSRWSGSP